MNPTYLIAAGICFVLLVSNTPSLTSWIGSFVKKTPSTGGSQCVRTQYPVTISDVNGRSHRFTICPQSAEVLLDDLQTQLDKRPTIKANLVS